MNMSLTSPPLRRLVALLLLPAACATGRADRVDPESPVGTVDPADPDAGPPIPADAFAEHVNGFGFDLYAELATKPGNFAFSPASITTALTMTWAGARGETAAQMADTLHLPAGFAVHDAYAQRIAAWNAETAGRQLAVANRLFGEQTAKFHDPFVALTGDLYGAALQPVDFVSGYEAARKTINDWVYDKTHERIADLLPEGSLDTDTRLVLTNAIYFKAKWMYEFDPKQTSPGAFRRDGDGPVDVPMMHLSTDLRYAEADGVRILQLPYADGETTMEILLPKARDGLAALEGKLSAGALARWSAATEATPVDLVLPKFKVAPPEAIPLKDPLTRLGMALPFSRDADFGGMADIHPLFIDDAYHKAFVEVSEEGTEAAAATAVVVKTESAAIEPEPISFVADHPFVFLVRDNAGTVLFAGRVADPSV